ncbi:MAG: DUF342 domain-containing protein [Planctomycetes bacterium]|nr:DUF342 domain-containing protein [Planctomycetota bacterium]
MASRLEFRFQADGLEARVDIIAGDALTPEDLDRAAADAGIKVPWLPGARDLAQKTVSDPAGTLENFLIAVGRLPELGEPGSTRWLIPRGVLPGRELPNGDIDYRERNYLRLVESGQTVATLHAGTPGRAGETVDGHVIDGVCSPRPEPRLLEGLMIDDEGRVVATRDGALVDLGPKGITVVKHIRHVGDVDLSVGNLEMQGSLEVTGSIGRAMRVRTSGDLMILGDVEDAVIDVGADLTVGRFIIGGPNCSIEARGHINCRGLRSVDVRAGGTVGIERESINSKVQGDRILALGPRTRVRGGELVAQREIDLVDVGAPSETPIRLVVGEPFLESKRLSRLEQGEARRQRAENGARRNERSKGGKRNRGRLEADDRLLKARLERRRAMRRLLKLAVIRIRGRIHPGCVCEFAGREWSCEQIQKGVILRFDAETETIVQEELKS